MEALVTTHNNSLLGIYSHLFFNFTPHNSRYFNPLVFLGNIVNFGLFFLIISQTSPFYFTTNDYLESFTATSRCFITDLVTVGKVKEEASATCHKWGEGGGGVIMGGVEIQPYFICNIIHL